MTMRYCLISPPAVLRTAFGYDDDADFPPRYNIAPSQPVSIVRHDFLRRRELALVRWGLIPAWAKDPARLSALFNARAETADEKPSFRGPLRHRRCLVPADGYYDWRTRGGRRRPYLVRPRSSGPIALAGLWEHWLGADGSEIETMAILTTPSAGHPAAVGDRMPIVIAAEDFGLWLDTRPGVVGEAGRLLRPPPPGLLEVLEIADHVNNPHAEGAELHRMPQMDR